MTARGSVQFARKWGRGLSTAVGILEWSGLSRSIDFDIYIFFDLCNNASKSGKLQETGCT